MPVTSDRARRKSTIIRLSLAGLAVLGIGAALTTAAWTNDAWFSAQADSATIELRGALANADGSCPAAADAKYLEADTATDALAITLAAGTFADLVPGETRTAGICLWNESTVDLSVSLAAISTTGDAIFGGSDPASIGVNDGNAQFGTKTIADNAVLPLAAVVTTPGDWDASYQGKTSGTVAISFTGTTDLP